MPTPMTTTGNTMYVKFRSDVSVATPGFRATWTVGKNHASRLENALYSIQLSMEFQLLIKTKMLGD